MFAQYAFNTVYRQALITSSRIPQWACSVLLCPCLSHAAAMKSHSVSLECTEARSDSRNSSLAVRADPSRRANIGTRSSTSPSEYWLAIIFRWRLRSVGCSCWRWWAVPRAFPIPSWSTRALCSATPEQRPNPSERGIRNYIRDIPKWTATPSQCPTTTRRGELPATAWNCAMKNCQLKWKLTVSHWDRLWVVI